MENIANGKMASVKRRVIAIIPSVAYAISDDEARRKEARLQR